MLPRIRTGRQLWFLTILAFGLVCADLAAQTQMAWQSLEPTSLGISTDQEILTEKEKSAVDEFLTFPVRDTPGPIGILGPEQLVGQPGGMDYPFNYAAQYLERERVTNQNGYLSYWRQDLTLGAPLLNPDKNLMLAMTLNLRWIDFETTAVLESTGRKFPADLYNVEPGLYYKQIFENGYFATATASLGSPSDKPFNSVRELAPTLSATLGVPRDNGDFYLLSFFYVPVSEIRFPLPGFAYQWNPSKDFQANIGLPFDLRWRFAEGWRLEAGYVPITSIRTMLYYDFAPKASLFGGFEWTNEQYLLADRPEWNQFFYSYEKRLSLGLRLQPCRYATLDLVGGYAFDRQFFFAKNYSHRYENQVDVAPGGFGMLRLGIRF